MKPILFYRIKEIFLKIGLRQIQIYRSVFEVISQENFRKYVNTSPVIYGASFS